MISSYIQPISFCSNTKHSPRKIDSIIKPCGYTFKNNKITSIKENAAGGTKATSSASGDDKDEITSDASVKKSKAIRSKAQNTKGGNKRKRTEIEEEEEEGKPAVKVKTDDETTEGTDEAAMKSEDDAMMRRVLNID